MNKQRQIDNFVDEAEVLAIEFLKNYDREIDADDRQLIRALAHGVAYAIVRTYPGIAIASDNASKY